MPSFIIPFIIVATIVFIVYNVLTAQKIDDEEIELTKSDIKELSRNVFFDQDFFSKN